MNAVELRSVSRSFGGIPAVRDVTLTVRKGDMFALVGPDGAGKTTVIRMLCGLLRPDGGTLSVEGFDLLKSAEEVKRRIGYLSQRFSLYGDLTIDENIEFFAEIHNVFRFKERREELLEFTRLTPFRGRLAEQLSGGMKQKLALACTLIHTPDIIFLDEPTTGVDPVSRRDFWKVLSALLKTGITIVMTTPYLDEAERCGTVALMNEGRIMVADTPRGLKERMPGVVAEVVGPDVRRMSRLLRRHQDVSEVQAFGDRVNILLPDAGALEGVVAWLRDEGVAVTDRRQVRPSLENVFISLLTGTGRS